MSAAVPAVHIETNAQPRTADSIDLDLSAPELFCDDRHLAFFARLREQAPLHWSPGRAGIGPFWSLTRHADILAADMDHRRFASGDSFLLQDTDPSFRLPMFLSMDPPEHTVYRDALKSFFTHAHLSDLETTIRALARRTLDELPASGVCDWVQVASRDFTSRVLALLLDYPDTQRDELMWWSDLATEGSCEGLDWHARQAEMMRCLGAFQAHHRQQTSASDNLFSRLCSIPGIRPSQLLGNLMMLLVAGNDTTRNSISCAALLLATQQALFQQIKQDPAMIKALLEEVFRWQSPIAYVRRRAAVEIEMHGQRIRAGDKVVLWYVSGNRDARVFGDPDTFNIHRPDIKQSMAFGFGIHRCLGVRLAQMQARVFWEEALPRLARIELAGPPLPVRSNFIRGLASLPVHLHT